MRARPTASAYAPNMKFRSTYAVAAAIAWFGLVLGMVLTVFNVNPLTTIAPNSLGLNDDGIAGLIGRVVDSLSYFTNLSNLIVAVVLTMLARNSTRGGAVWHAMRMDSLVMISITGLIYALVLAPDAQVEGVDLVVNAIKHYIVPALTVVIWLIAGPRRQVTFGSIFTALVLPLAWAAYTLVRGVFIDAYPYGFVNVADFGLQAVLVNIAGIAAFGIVLGLIFWGLDRLISTVGKSATQ
jgi:hypothetical protein